MLSDLLQADRTISTLQKFQLPLEQSNRSVQPIRVGDIRPFSTDPVIRKDQQPAAENGPRQMVQPRQLGNPINQPAIHCTHRLREALAVFSAIRRKNVMTPAPTKIAIIGSTGCRKRGSPKVSKQTIITPITGAPINQRARRITCDLHRRTRPINEKGANAR